MEISRELGGIAERLRSIDDHMADFKDERSSMWKRIDAVSRSVKSLELKVAIMAAAISFFISNFDLIVKLFK